MGVEVRDADGVQPGENPGVKRRVEVLEAGTSGRHLLEVDELVVVPLETLNVSEEVRGVHVLGLNGLNFAVDDLGIGTV